jgi:WD40 repeat protein
LPDEADLRLIQEALKLSAHILSVDPGQLPTQVTGRLLGQDSVWALAVTPDGRRAVSGSLDNTLKVWDLERGECLATFTGKSSMHACAVAGDGRNIVAQCSFGIVHILRLEGVQPLACLPEAPEGIVNNPVTSPGWAPD